MTTTDCATFAAADRKLTGTCALLVAALSLVAIPLYFLYSGPPPASNVLIRDLITVVVFTIFLVFTTGLKRVIGRGAGLAGEIAGTSGLVYAAMTLVSASLETGVVLEYPDGSKDPTIDGPLANGIVLLHGPIARLLLAVFFLALAVAVRRTDALPRRVRTGSVLLALVNLAFVPSLFFGMDPANFYAANGWGSTASIGMLNMLWIGAIGAAILRQGRAPAGIRRRAHTALSAG